MCDTMEEKNYLSEEEKRREKNIEIKKIKSKYLQLHKELFKNEYATRDDMLEKESEKLDVAEKEELEKCNLKYK